MYIYENFLFLSRKCLFRCHGNEYHRKNNFCLWMLVSTKSEIMKLVLKLIIIPQIPWFNLISIQTLKRYKIKWFQKNIASQWISKLLNNYQETPIFIDRRGKHPRICILKPFSGNQTMLEHLMLSYGLFISNKDITGLITMETVTKETSYFPRPIVIFAVYVVCFLGD